MQNEAFSTLVAELYRDVTYPDGWRTFFIALSDVMNFDSTSLYIDDIGGIATDKFESINASESAIREYGEYFYTKDLWAQSLPNMPLYQFHSSTALVSDRDLKNSELYNDYLKKHDMRWCCATYIDNPASSHALKIAMQRSHSRAAFDQQEVDTFNLLLPHLQNALNIHRRFCGVDPLRSSFEVVANILDSAAFLLDSNHKLIAKNSLAEDMLRHKEAHLDGRRVSFFAQTLNKAVQKLISQMTQFVEGKCNSYQQFASVGNAQNSYQVRVDALPLPTTFLGQQELGVLVQIKRSNSQPKVSHAGLKYLFGLTSMEAEAVYWLCHGKSAAEIAQQLSVKESTVRSHIKAAYAKLGVSKQTELVTVVLASLASAH